MEEPAKAKHTSLLCFHNGEERKKGFLVIVTCRTGTVGLVLNGLASCLFRAEGEVARVLAPAPRRRRVQGAGVLVGALGVGGTFVGLNAPGGYVADHAG